MEPDDKNMTQKVLTSEARRALAEAEERRKRPPRPRAHPFRRLGNQGPHQRFL